MPDSQSVDTISAVGGDAPTAAAISTPTTSVEVPKLVEAKPDVATQAKPPTAADAITLSQEQFKERLQRSKSSFLREKFGTDNIEELTAQFAEAKKLKEADDQRRREALTEKQRLEEDLAKERAARQQAEQRAQQLAQREELNKEKRRVLSLAGKYVDQASLDFAMLKWAKDAQALSKKELARMTDGDLEKWFKDFARSNPKHARALVQKQAPQVSTQGPTNGPGPAQRPGGGQARPVSPQVKTARPGQPNSMTKAEIRKQFGVSW